VYGGLQDNGSWMDLASPNGVENKDWRNVGFGTAFTLGRPLDKDIVYSDFTVQVLRFHKSTGEISGQAAAKARRTKYRFNWNTACWLSPTNKK
jgi:hypothetical protein